MEYQIQDHILPLHHVGFIVKDIDHSLDFYMNKLGFTLYNRWTEPVEEVENGMCIPGASLELAQVKGYGFLLEFIRFVTGEGSDEKFLSNHIGTGHISFLVDDLPAAIEHLKSQGVEFCSEPVMLPNSSWVMFYDPDGIRVEIMQFYRNGGFEER
ncbi:MAG: VOC family protein [Subdoligranulum sp.]|nr:VOC family protein [Subdoligranulum sp.]